MTLLQLMEEIVGEWPAGETKTLRDIEQEFTALGSWQLSTVYDDAFLDSEELAIVRYMDQHPEFVRATFGFAGALSWRRR